MFIWWDNNGKIQNKLVKSSLLKNRKNIFNFPMKKINEDSTWQIDFEEHNGWHVD